jgi:hypothetical protein
VGHQDDRRSFVGVEVMQQIKDSLSGCVIEVSGWLVSKENLG